MKAAVFRKPGTPLSIESVETPQVAPDEVLVKVAACGVCHSDLHYIDSGVPTFKDPPLILGHEATGTVVETGSAVEGVKEGNRVLIPAMLDCGGCLFCRKGRGNLCVSGKMPGNHIDGAYAEFVKAPARSLVSLPESISLVEAALLADAVSTPYHAIKSRAKLKGGEWIAILGCGGLGLNAVQIAAMFGAHVIAVDLVESKLQLAKTLGAEAMINAGETEKVEEEIQELSEGGVDVAIEAIGNPATINQAFRSLRRGGRLCVLGYTNQPFALNPARLMFRELEVLGTLGCTPAEYLEVVCLLETERISLKPLITGRFPLAQINDALEQLRCGKAIRSVILPHGEVTA